MKNCSTCKKPKPLDQYRVDKSSSDGRQSRCAGCQRVADAEYRDRNRARIKAKQDQWHLDNPGRACETAKAIKGRDPEGYRRKKREYRARNSESMLAYERKYRADNQDGLRKYIREYRVARRKVDPDFQAGICARQLLHRTLRQTTECKDSSTVDALGYTAKQLKDHLESLFKPGMSWCDRSEWHIDHIKPVSVFIKEGVTDPKLINALDNLQPLWAAENISKGSSWHNSR